jgi:hypothetical protein
MTRFRFRHFGFVVSPDRQTIALGFGKISLRRRFSHLAHPRKKRPTTAPEVLRVIRGVQVLEFIGTSEAKRLLKRLSQGKPGNWLTREAKAAVGRLARGSPVKP